MGNKCHVIYQNCVEGGVVIFNSQGWRKRRLGSNRGGGQLEETAAGLFRLSKGKP